MTSTPGAHWFSRNPDKAWGEKFFLSFVPVFFAYNALVQQMGWLDVGTFWHVAQNLLMWLPYCVLLPAWLRRDSGVPWRESYWFKFNVYMTVWIFYATYFHTEYFFEVLGLRYHFPGVEVAFDSALVGPDESTAAGEFKFRQRRLAFLPADGFCDQIQFLRAGPKMLGVGHGFVVGEAASE